MVTKNLKAVRTNEFYQTTDVPALTLISNSKSWMGVIFWYIIFLVFSTICVISLSRQYNEFRNNPTKTDVANVRASVMRVPNISLCLTGWPSLPLNTLWSPTINSTADGPTWPYYLPDYVKLELVLMEKQGRKLLHDHWPYYVFIYVEEYVRTLLKIELNGQKVEPWWLDMEKKVIQTFRNYNITMDELISKYAIELLHISGCAEKWPKNMTYTVWPFVDPREVNDRCLYVTHNLTLTQELSNQIEPTAILHSCKAVDFAHLQREALQRARALASLDHSKTSLSESKALFSEELVQCKQWYYVDDWCHGINMCPLEKQLCAACGPDEFACGDGLCIHVEYKCDGETDCKSTGADEIHCGATPNNPNTTGWIVCCGTNGTEPCHPSTRCNGVYDCVNGEDELDCTQGCGEGFDCGDGQCIPNRFRCDGVRFTNDGGKVIEHCFNGADEVNCSDSVNATPMFKCDESNSIPTYRRCDGVPDCENNLDEDNCEINVYSPKCRLQGYAKCGDTLSHCFYDNPIYPDQSEKCNGMMDCTNKIDERNCANRCHEGLLTCNNANNETLTADTKVCYKPNDKCDGYEDCDDGSDEEDCLAEVEDEEEDRNVTIIDDSCDGDDMFHCGDARCIPNVYTCNGVSDCLNYEDESAVTCARNTTITDICQAIEYILPQNCINRGIPSAHSDNCVQHVMPWRQRGQFVALNQTHNFHLMCNGKHDCNNGIDELAYICGNYRIISTAKPKLVHMSLTMDPNCVMPEETETEAKDLELEDAEWSQYSNDSEVRRRKRLTTDDAYYFSRQLPITLSDCIEACLYLSDKDARNVDIGLTFNRTSASTWSGECTAIRYNMSTTSCELIGTCSEFERNFTKNGCLPKPNKVSACFGQKQGLYYTKTRGQVKRLLRRSVRERGIGLMEGIYDDENVNENGHDNALFSCQKMPRGSAMSHRCEMLNIVYGLQHSIVNVTERQARITVDAPTSSPLFYNLPNVVANIEKIYEARLSITQHFRLITECNDENVSTRQCQLSCRRKFLRSRCSKCRPSTLADQLLGVKTDNVTETKQISCTIQIYKNCYPLGGSADANGNETTMRDCLNLCKPACDYWEYKLTHEEIKHGNKYIEQLIVPLNDYVQFTQEWAYTWFKVVAEIGGLLEFWVGAGLVTFVHIALYMSEKASTALRRKLWREAIGDAADKPIMHNKMLELGEIKVASNDNATDTYATMDKCKALEAELAKLQTTVRSLTERINLKHE